MKLALGGLYQLPRLCGWIGSPGGWEWVTGPGMSIRTPVHSQRFWQPTRRSWTRGGLQETFICPLALFWTTAEHTDIKTLLYFFFVNRKLGLSWQGWEAALLSGKDCLWGLLAALSNLSETECWNVLFLNIRQLLNLGLYLTTAHYWILSDIVYIKQLALC